MNNEQFRRLVGSQAAPSDGQKNGTGQKTSSPAPGGGGALGSRMRSSIPMTPRSVAGGGSRSEFARQLAARDLANKPQKTFKTSAPKGSRLATGYVDRTKTREDEEADERAERIKALEELLKEEKIDQETFDKQRNAIAGGDLASTHLVKGLDFKLLERVRRGEDVYGDSAETPPEEEAGEEVDDEFEALAEKDVQAVAKEKVAKKGQLAPVALIPGKKRTRDQIVAEMKAARAAAAKAQQEASLGDRFRKIGAKQKAGTRIERDSKGREVLIVIDEDGHEKRKVRKLQPEQEEARQREQMRPDENVAPLGMEVPEIYRKQQEAAEEEEDDDGDIFADAGDDYDPLAGMSDSDEDEEDTKAPTDDATSREEDKDGTKAMPPPPKPARPQNYFEGSKSELLSSRVHKAPSMSDPALQAAFQKAAQLGSKERTADREADEQDEEAKKRAEKHRQMLESASRDDEDLDMGFGTSRFEDEEDFDETKVKLSEWGGDDDGEGGSKGGKGKRKRGPKKRKGDANNAEDVLRVMQERKGASKS